SDSTTVAIAGPPSAATTTCGTFTLPATTFGLLCPFVVCSSGGQAHSGVARHAPAARHRASAEPNTDSRGIDRSVITMVSLLAKRFVRAEVAPSARTGAETRGRL